ncbi:MAG: hypothetical protein IPN71_07375 [Fibrobacteres bacterium]|nr:hypothetical protein [Fibrobacterota bacterium]
MIKAYPVDALEFLAEDVFAARGQPMDCEFLDPAVVKEDVAEPGPGQAMDLAVRYAFASGTGVLILLVEHWSDATRLDLLRTARYYLDLCRRFPDDEILPIALVDDDRPHGLRDTVERGAMGRNFLSFCTRIVQVPAMDLVRFRSSCNRVALSFSPIMGGRFDRVEQVVHVAVEFKRQGDLEGFRKFFAFWVIEGRLDLNEQRRLRARFKEMEMPEIIQWWIEEGLEKGRIAGRLEGDRARALLDARRMLEHGIAWDVVTDVTGVTPEDLA